METMRASSGRRIGRVVTLLVVTASLLTLSGAGAVPSSSEACRLMNGPEVDGHYADGMAEFGFVGPFFVGETITIGTVDPVAGSLVMALHDASVINLEPAGPAAHVHTFTTPGTATWLSLRTATLPIDPVAITWAISCTPAAPPVISPFGAVVDEPASGGSTIVKVPVYLSAPSAEPVSVDYATVAEDRSGIAASGSDFTPASGTAHFAPGETVAHVPIEILGDGASEPGLLWGEWLIIEFTNPVGATAIDVDTFFGAGLVIIVDAD